MTDCAPRPLLQVYHWLVTGEVSPQEVARTLRVACRAAGPEGLPDHGVLECLAVWLASGMDAPTITGWLGHQIGVDALL